MDLNETEFDDILKRYFPQANICLNRLSDLDEQGYGWTRSIDLTLICLQIEMYTSAKSQYTPGTVIVSLEGLTEEGDGIELWKTSSMHKEGLHDCLQEAREQVLGLAQGLFRICEKPDPQWVPITSEIPFGSNWNKDEFWQQPKQDGFFLLKDLQACMAPAPNNMPDIDDIIDQVLDAADPGREDSLVDFLDGLDL